MSSVLSRRGSLVIALGLGLLVLFLSLGALNAFNLKLLNPASPSETLVFTSLSIVAFLLFLAVLVLLVRNVLKLYADQRSRVLGTRLRTRMLWGAVLVSLIPLGFMVAFSYLLMNRAVDRWFSQPVTQMRDDASRMAASLLQYASANARAEAASIAVDLPAPESASHRDHPHPLQGSVQSMLDRHLLTLEGGFAVVYRNGRPQADVQLPRGTGVPHTIDEAAYADAADDTALPARRDQPPLAAVPLLTLAQQHAGEPVTFGANEFVLASEPAAGGREIVVGLPLPDGIADALTRLRMESSAYGALYRERRQVRLLYTVLLALITALALFACCWLALNLSKQVTRPIDSLAEAMEAIADGAYDQRVGEASTEELGELADSFNAMAANLDASRSLAEHAAMETSAANASLEARRTELETIIETIPNGVATLTPAGDVVLANRGFCELLDPGGRRAFAGLSLTAMFAPDAGVTLDHLLRRSHRMGSATAELDLPDVGSGSRHVALTVALLEGRSHGAAAHLGYVLVLENLTELLRAQKQSAWKEVARRVAHEIKNPLTPISLNAEQIHRHIGRLAPVLAESGIVSPSPAVIVRSSEVISASVETMRQLVDQFSALAEFPSAQPQPADLNNIAEAALTLFSGRIGDVAVRLALAPDLPLVLADPEALKRALTNIIDNALEALDGALLREISISTRALASGTVELTVADSGSGLTDDMRERLFLPYVSSKARGTGLGLSIAAKVVQDLGGSLRAECNIPRGALFILELCRAYPAEATVAPAIEDQVHI